MKIIEIKALDNGAHINQTWNSQGYDIPEGYAMMPDDIETPNFPFGEIEVEEIDGVMTVTKWVAGTIPEPEPEPEPPVSEIEQLRADIDYISIMTGVEL